MLVGLRFTRDPQALHFTVGTVGSFTRFLLRQDAPFATGARIIHGDAVPRRTAWDRILAEDGGDNPTMDWHEATTALDLFRSSAARDGSWAQLTLRRCSAPSRVRNRTCEVDAVVHANDGRLLSVRASDVACVASHLPAHGIEQLTPAHVSATDASDKAVAHTLHMLAAGAAARRAAARTSRRRSLLGSVALPYARLTGCPATGMRAVRLGLLLDFGFVTAYGGRAAALLAATESVSRATTTLASPRPCFSAHLYTPVPRVSRYRVYVHHSHATRFHNLKVSRANAVFEQQLGIRLLVSTVVVNQAGGGDDQATGPNFAPSTPGIEL